MCYTWMDIEWKLKSKRKDWPSYWEAVDVYPEEIVVSYHESDIENVYNDSLNFISSVLDNAALTVKDADVFINLSLSEKKIAVVLEKVEKGTSPAKKPLPLFKNSMYQELYPSKLAYSPFETPVIAFYSYKGGVGRTLSLVALLNELSKNKGFKTLVVDADVEAPGLTLITKDTFHPENRMSYADILSIIHDTDDSELFGETLANIADSMINATITIPGNEVDAEHFFLPAYRYDYQQLDNFVHPETIISMPERTFIIQEFLSKLAKMLKADAVIIDLRAGLSELSAPFLFDPRVKRIFVATTSKQSIDGTKFTIDKIFSSSFPLEYDEEKTIDMTVLLNMVPKGFDEDKLGNIIFDLVVMIPPNSGNCTAGEAETEYNASLSDIVITSNFSDSLIHLEDLKQINDSLKGTDVLYTAGVLSKRLSLTDINLKHKTATFSDSDRKEIIDKINEITSKEITAEGRSDVRIMATGALEKLCRAHQNNVPRIVVLGAKGSGKTYVYKQLLDRVYWENFITTILPNEDKQNEKTMIMPVLTTINRDKMDDLLSNCFKTINAALSIKCDLNNLNNNAGILQQANENTAMNPTEWLRIWTDIFLNSLSKEKYPDFSVLDETLSSLGEKIVFIVDGLEDIFNETISQKNSQAAIKYLCQDIVNKIKEYKNIGIIIFVRSDICKNSIPTNYTQFQNQYLDYELKWSQDEALRLVVWILAQVDFSDLKKIERDIPRLTSSNIDNRLIPFWGLKLGRNNNEAFSTRWIISALSDLNLQIQARDVIRFLASVTSLYAKDIYYFDRILLPPDIRKAIVPCSQGKLEEVSKEMASLKVIFDKLENPGIDKKLPIKAEDMNNILSNEERMQLEIQGYLGTVNNNYYIPEIIRHALGYEYAKGARPKVISLLRKK